MFEYDNGFRKAMYWSKEKMMAHADQYSSAFSRKAFERIQNGEVPESEMWKFSSFWYKDFDGMAIKTMLRQIISKWGIMSIDLQKAVVSDGGSINEDMSSDILDVAANEPEQVVETVEVQQPAEQPTPQVEAKEAPPKPQAVQQAQPKEPVKAAPSNTNDELDKAFFG